MDNRLFLRCFTETFLLHVAYPTRQIDVPHDLRHPPCLDPRLAYTSYPITIRELGFLVAIGIFKDLTAG